MIRGAGIGGVALLLAFVMQFSRLNSSQRVTLDLGFWVWYRVPVLYVAFAGVFLGMVVMLLANLHTDLRVRAVLRERLEEETRADRTWVDQTQRDLFGDGDVPSPPPSQE